MTPPVLLDALSGASTTVAANAAGSSPPDPALAAEFAALLGSAGIPGEIAATGTIAPAIGEGDGTTARSAVALEILDSADSLATTNDTPPGKGAPKPGLDALLPCVMPPIPGLTPVATTAPNVPTLVVPPAVSGTSATSPGLGSVPCATASTPFRPLPIGDGGGEEGGEISLSDPTSDGATPSTLPDALLADITAISGGDARGADDGSGEGDERRETAPGNPIHLATERAGHLDGGRVSGVEARPLDRGERTRIVHEVIDRVSKHVETLAVTRSKDPLTIRLEPADLGRIVVEISRETSGLSAEMSASDPRVAEALDRHRSELVAGLASRGHTEARVTVQTASNAETPAFDLRRDPGQSGQHGHPPRHHSPIGHGNSQGTRGDAATLVHAAQRSRSRVRATGLDLEI